MIPSCRNLGVGHSLIQRWNLALSGNILSAKPSLRKKKLYATPLPRPLSRARDQSRTKGCLLAKGFNLESVANNQYLPFMLSGVITSVTSSRMWSFLRCLPVLAFFSLCQWLRLGPGETTPGWGRTCPGWVAVSIGLGLEQIHERQSFVLRVRSSKVLDCQT